jgi:hypothetical protein
MNEEIDPEESLFRAVNPKVLEKGKITSALFKDSKGVSVNRSNEDSERSLGLLIERLGCKEIAELKVADCLKVEVYIKYCPLRGNPFHTEIHNSIDKVTLSQGKARKLAVLCKRLVVG